MIQMLVVLKDFSLPARLVLTIFIHILEKLCLYLARNGVLQRIHVKTAIIYITVIFKMLFLIKFRDMCVQCAARSGERTGIIIKKWIIDHGKAYGESVKVRYSYLHYDCELRLTEISVFRQDEMKPLTICRRLLFSV